MKIQIISGTYGFRPDGGSRVMPINMGETCDVSAEEAERLVSLGVARYVAADAVKTDDAAVNDDSTGGNMGGNKTPSAVNTDGVDIPDTLDIVDGHFTEESLREMTNANLAKLGEDLGLDVKKCKTKDDFVELLAGIELDIAETEDDDDENLPNLDDETVVE